MKSRSLVTALAVIGFASASTSVTFSYKPDSEVNPSVWPSIDLGEEIENQCGGSKQSGIDIPARQCGEFDDYVFAGGSCSLDDLDFEITPYSIVATYNTTKNDCTPPQMKIPGQNMTFDALQFHFHTGSDHAMDGRYYGAEMHLVHIETGGSGRLSVLGFFVEATDSDGLQKFRDLLAEWEAVAASTILACQAQNVTIWSSQTPFPGNTNSSVVAQQRVGERRTSRVEEQEHRELARSFNPYDLIPEGSSMYTYEGSLTTPPCAEIVFWNVIDTPVSVSVREFVRLTNVLIDYADPETCALASEAAPSGFTGRPVQPINGRTITRFCPTTPGFVDAMAPPQHLCPESIADKSTAKGGTSKAIATTVSSLVSTAAAVAVVTAGMGLM